MIVQKAFSIALGQAMLKVCSIDVARLPGLAVKPHLNCKLSSLYLCFIVYLKLF